jgi:heme A synthase
LQGVDELPDEILDLIYHLTFTAHHVHLAMGYVLLVLSVVLLCWLVRRLRRHSTAEVFPDPDVVTSK